LKNILPGKIVLGLLLKNLFFGGIKREYKYTFTKEIGAKNNRGE